MKRPISRRKRWKTLLAGLLLAALSTLALGVIGLAVLIQRLRPTLPTIAQIAGFRPAEATCIYSSDGVLLARLQMENRQVVPLQAIAPCLIQATLAVEDSRFYEHHGLDWRGIARAAVVNLLHDDATRQGASTITQQLARNVSQFHISREKHFTRKLREALTAVRIEQVFDKDQILELYLNQIYYGSGAYGAEAAARTYFGKSAAKLTLAEAALLAGLPQRPQAYSPYTNRAAAQARRDVVLKRMLETGRIHRADYDRARREPIRLAGLRPHNRLYRAPYFVDWITRDLTARYGVDAVYSGWTIITTLDWRMQAQAERALTHGLSYDATQGALICLDPHNGQVRAMVGGVDYRKDRFNAVTQGKRQPGSAFKPIVYAAALDTGTVTLYDKLRDEPKDYGTPGRPWVVRDYGEYANRDMTVLEAITHSVNTIAVETANETGLDRVINYARALGIKSDLAPYLPLALGASAVRPLDLCAAYGVFASVGERYEPTGLQEVRDGSGHMIQRDNPWQRRTAGILQPTTLGQMNFALREVVLHGTGAAAAAVPNAFGKTGTTNDRRDAWFVGYTPELVTAVWLAHPVRARSGALRYQVMNGATGGKAAAPIWARFMRKAVGIQREVNRKRGLRLWEIPLPPPVKDQPDRRAERPQEPDQAADPAAWNDTTQTSSDFRGSASASGGTTTSTASLWQPTAGESVVYADGGRTLPGAGAGSEEGTELVSLCADSGRLATEWCPTTVLIRVRRGHAPWGSCTLHRPPPGER